MRALPWLIAAALLGLIVIQMENYQDGVEEYKVERDQARADFQDGAKIFWDAQTSSAAVRSAYRLRQVEMGLTIKQQRLIIDAYEAELKYYRAVCPGIIPATAIPE